MVSVKIGNNFVGENNPCFVSFEPGATYSNFNDAKKMLNSVMESGAHAVKFQTFLPGDSDKIMGKKDIVVEFSDTQGKKQEKIERLNFKTIRFDQKKWTHNLVLHYLN